jgi:hypothetical protein
MYQVEFTLESIEDMRLFRKHQRKRVAEIDDFNREIELTRQNKELMKFLDLRAKQTKIIPLDEVKIQLGLSEQD